MNFPPTAISSGRARTRALVRTLALGVLLGLGGVGAGTTLVQAADDAGVLDFLLGDVPRSLGLPARAPRPEAALLRERRVRWTGRPARAEAERPRWRDPAPHPRAAAARPAFHRPAREAAREPAAVAGSQDRLAGSHDRTVCVRTCDGYMFPLANLEGRSVPRSHGQACAAACPGAETALYTVRAGQELDQAISPEGRPYRSLAAAFSYRTKAAAGCSCDPGKGGYAALLRTDATLQPGDAVADGTGGRVFAGRDRAGEARYVEVRRAAMLSSGARRDLDRTLDLTRLERARAEFRRALVAQSREAGRLRYASRAGGFAEVVSDAGFLPVRVVAPSPFR
ncbi:DUF2865 domain-containing protein [Methylobacterium platani]|uniref:DUF2865 domain-containing protein n=2 Tax=Methylobacterium platani TaxID=427683 RepID=A0A179SA30_9HYPH|nr:DUF2865 domain-containing protein [Methylobacterium platani]KMO21512.1 hypothetical protein SQ03_03035 [Methylobacterium platani JCM 14648]OAS24273.1 hypothetical protein A5481_14530 [Methylobacterium platani]